MSAARTTRSTWRRAALVIVLIAIGQGLAGCDRCGDFNIRLPGTGSCRAPAPAQ